MPSAVEKIENPASPGRVYRVDRRKAMRDALLAVLPSAAPGLTVAEGETR